MSLACSRCTDALVGRRIGDVVVHECPGCAGVFLDENAIALVVQDTSNARATAVVSALPRTAPATSDDAPLYVRCPACEQMMNRKLFGDIVIDVCRDHGVFFDAGELPDLIDFVVSGGLAKVSARRTADRIPLAKQPDNFAKTLQLTRGDRPSAPDLRSLAPGGALVELLFTLFG